MRTPNFRGVKYFAFDSHSQWQQNQNSKWEWFDCKPWALTTEYAALGNSEGRRWGGQEVGRKNKGREGEREGKRKEGMLSGVPAQHKYYFLNFTAHWNHLANLKYIYIYWCLGPTGRDSSLIGLVCSLAIRTVNAPRGFWRAAKLKPLL